MVILYADDDSDDREFFANAMKQINPNIKIIHAKNGYDALQIISNAEMDLPDIVFLDINMPLLDGYETFAKLLKDKRLSNMKFVFYSTGVATKVTIPINGTKISYLKKVTTINETIEQLRAVIEE